MYRVNLIHVQGKPNTCTWVDFKLQLHVLILHRTRFYCQPNYFNPVKTKTRLHLLEFQITLR